MTEIRVVFMFQPKWNSLKCGSQVEERMEKLGCALTGDASGERNLFEFNKDEFMNSVALP